MGRVDVFWCRIFFLLVYTSFVLFQWSGYIQLSGKYLFEMAVRI